MSQQQHMEASSNSDQLLRSLEPNTLTSSSSSSRLPLRKRVAPVLKWQPVETPQEHVKQKPIYNNNSYPLQQQQQQYPPSPPSVSLVENSSDAMETDEEKPIVQEGNDMVVSNSKLLKKHWITKEDSKRSFSEESTSSSGNTNKDRPAKKVKRGRPPLAKQQSNTSTLDSKSYSNEQSLNTLTPSSTTTTTTRHPLPEVDTSVLYCICKRPYDVPRFMIACDKCDQWFHGECIQISEKQGEFIDLYFCENCAKITGKKTIWKPQCANPACQKAARIGTHQGHLSKYCSDTCGMQVARARIELAEMKKRNALESSTNDSLNNLNNQHYNPLSRGKLSSFADMDDRARLTRVKDEKAHAKFIISIGEHKSALLSLLIQHQKEEICGFDSRLSWPDSLWEKVSHVEHQEDNNHVLTNENGDPITTSKPFTICQQSRKCNKHTNWQKLKTSELEQERSEQFVILTMLERERQQIKARMKKRREEVDLADFLENGTITHS